MSNVYFSVEKLNLKQIKCYFSCSFSDKKISFVIMKDFCLVKILHFKVL